MKAITLPVAELRTALAGLGKVIARKSPLPELGCVRIQRHADGQIDLAVTDLERTATFMVDSPDHAGALTLLVPFEDLSNVAASCGKGESLTLESTARDTATIRFPIAGQSGEHPCRVLLPDKFPVQPPIKAQEVPLPNGIREAIHEALDCSSLDPTRLIINGAFIDVSAKGAHYVVGTDGRHLFSSNSFALSLTNSIIIPRHKFLGWKGFNQDGDWKLKVTPGDDAGGPRFELLSDRWRFLSRTFEGVYPNWRAVVPSSSNFRVRITFSTEAVQQVMRAAQELPTPDERHQTIGIELANSRLNILGKPQRAAPWTKVEVCGAEVSGPDMKLFLDRHMLVKALRFGLNRLEFIDEISPVRFSAEGRQMIVMPLRPDSGAASTPAPSPRPAAPAVAGTNTSPPPTAEPPQNTTMPNRNHETIPEASRQVGARDIASSRPPISAPQGQEESKPALEQALVQIEGIKTGFREAISGLTKLGDTIRGAMREQKASDKDLHTVRQTLRSLQGVRI